MKSLIFSWFTSKLSCACTIAVLPAWSALQRADGFVFFWRFDGGSAISVRSSTSRLPVSAFAMLAAFSLLPAGSLFPCLVRVAGLTHHHPAGTLQQLTVIKLISYFLICPRNYSTANLISLYNAEKEEGFFCSLTGKNEYRKITNIIDLIILFALLLVELAKKYFSFNKVDRDEVPFDEFI